MAAENEGTTRRLHAAFWQVISLVFLGCLFLLLTDNAEIHQITNPIQTKDSNYNKTLPSTSTSAPTDSISSTDLSNDTIPNETNPAPTDPPGTVSTNDNAAIPQDEKTSTAEPQTPTETEKPTEAPQQEEKNPNDSTETKENSESRERYTYQPRGQPLTDKERDAMVQEWGSWTLVDTKDRPLRTDANGEDFYSKYPNRDIPRSDFPPNAWQIDREYLDEFFPQALALVDRAQTAILAEYGKSIPTDSDSNTEPHMFQVDILDTWQGQDSRLKPPRRGKGGDPSMERGGITSRQSWNGLVRRILHAIMTEDNFVFAMGGHSAAAGHGNHFVQSYTSQVQWVLEAVFARLGVKHEARNFGMGGLGTTQNALATGFIYGPDVDMLMWDSSMTEPDDGSQDILHRQGLLGGQKVPVLWSLSMSTIRPLHENAGADVGYAGEGLAGIPKAKTMDELDSLPWAARYVSCSGELKRICDDNEYMGVCWIDRDDFKPQVGQNNAPGGRASWHPGNRKHQLRGRVLAFVILSALKEALTIWKNAEGYELPDSAWHVTEHYERIRANVTSDTGACHENLKKYGLAFACNYPIQARTEFTPRAYPSHSHIRSLLPPEQREQVGTPAKNAYSPPDIFNPNLHPPKGAIDVLNIVEQGVPFQSVHVPDYTYWYKEPKFARIPKVPLGKGIEVRGKAGDPFCDGSVNSFCGRGSDNGCMLYGHNDGRNGIAYDGYSGWLVLNLPDVKNGYIAVKYHSWHKADDIHKTEGWKSINNERSLRSNTYGSGSTPTLNATSASGETQNADRFLKKTKPAPFCDDFQFEYAIDGKITVLNLEQWQERSHQIQRVVEVLSLLKDPDYTGGSQREVEVAIRITGCQRKKHFQLTHVYWS